MNKKKKFILIMSFIIIFVIIFTLIIIISSNKKYNDDNLLIDSNTKKYYQKIGYVNLDISNDLMITSSENDAIINFNDKTIMIKSNSNFSIFPKNNNFKITYSGYYVNFEIGKILNKIIVNGIAYSVNEINLENYIIKNDTSISATYDDFEVAGVACYVSNDEINVTKNIIIDNEQLSATDDNNIFYTYLKRNVNIDTINKNDFETTIEFNYSKVVNKNIIDFEFTFELIFNKNLMTAYIILRDSQNNFDIFEISYYDNEGYYKIENISSQNSKINSIILKFDDDIETKNEYQKI